MQKQYVFNRHLNNNYKKEQNKLLSKRIKKVKSSIDIRCPESFTFYKNHFKSNKKNNKLEKLEQRKINLLMFTKLNKIHQTPNHKIIKKILPNIENKNKRTISINREKKLEILKINKYLKNKINNQNSFYDVNKLNKEYKQNQNFKKYICEFPSINFNKKYSSSTCRNNDDNKKYNTSIIGSTSLYKDVKFKNVNVRSRRFINLENQKNVYEF